MRKLFCSFALLAAVAATVAAVPSMPLLQNEKTSDKKSAAKVEVYHAKDGWRFRVVGPEGKTLAVGVQGFIRKADCLVAVETLKAALNNSKVAEISKGKKN